MKRHKVKSNFGFTLIELLVVIAVIGILAAAIIVAINPVEQIRRGKDAATKSSTQQLADGVNGYYAAKSGVLPVGNTTWISQLTGSGDIKTIPAQPTTPCTTGTNVYAQNGYCYIVVGASPIDFVVFAQLESTAEENKCITSGSIAYYVYSSKDGKAGTYCANTAPSGTSLGTASIYN